MPEASPGPSDDEPTFSLVNTVASADEDRLVALLDHRGFARLTLNGQKIRDKASFLRQVTADLPAVEGMEAHNWDAFADLYWNIVFEITHDQVALVWTAAQVMVHGDLTDFLDAVRILSDAARSIMNDEPRKQAVLLFLVGDGPEFRPLPASP